MNRFLKYDGPLISFLSRIADLIILNLLFLLCCIPIVTIGAAWTALHSVAMKYVLDEYEPIVFRTFFKAFRQNFKQATSMWLLFLAAFGLLLFDIRVIWSVGNQIFLPVQFVVFVAFIVLLLIMMYAFPIQARFNNTIRQTLKNAFIMSILNFIRTLIMAIVYIAPICFILLNEGVIPVVLLLGFSGTVYANCYLWKPIFQKYIPEDGQEQE